MDELTPRLRISLIVPFTGRNVLFCRTVPTSMFRFFSSSSASSRVVKKLSHVTFLPCKVFFHQVVCPDMAAFCKQKMFCCQRESNSLCHI